MGNIEFNIVDGFPRELLSCPVGDLTSILKVPTLIEVKGVHTQPLFVSILLHGNEHSGFLALQELAKKFVDQLWPRSLIIFIGNIKAAAVNQRHLLHQPDYNRIWGGGALPEHDLADAIVNYVKDRSPIACVDIHNNTGKNPHYGCISRLDQATLNLGLMFSKTLVYFTKPHTTLSVRFSHYLPSITIECGLSGDALSVSHITSFLSDLMHQHELTLHPISHRDIDLYETIARLVIPDAVSFAFSHEALSQNADIVLRSDLDCLNFSELPPGTPIGEFRGQSRISLQDPDGGYLEDDYLDYKDGQIRLVQLVIPSMFTLNKEVIRQDCVGYLMVPKSFE